MLTTNIGRTVLIINAVFVVLCLAILISRFWAAQIIHRQVFVDDIFTFIACISMLGFSAMILWTVPNGVGLHIQGLDSTQLAVMYKALLGGTVTWLVATVFIKMAILCLYLRIFTTRNFKYYAWTIMAVCVVYLIVFMPWVMTNCIPISQAWHPTSAGHCRDLRLPMLISVSINMVLDILIVALPMPWLWNLKIKTRKKVFVSLMFSIGFTTVGMSAWRIGVTASSFSEADISYGLARIALISGFELWLGFIAANMPALAPLVAHRFKPVRTSSYDPIHYRNSRDITNRRDTNVTDGEKVPSADDVEQQHGAGSTTSQLDCSIPFCINTDTILTIDSTSPSARYAA